MTWSTGIVRVVDETTLTSCEKNLGRVTARANTSPTYADELAKAALYWMHQIWPPDREYSRTHYMTVVAADLDSMPLNLLERLADRLHDAQGGSGDPRGMRGRAAGLLSCWLRIRILQLRGHAAVQPGATFVRAAYDQFLSQLIASSNAPAPRLPGYVAASESAAPYRFST